MCSDSTLYAKICCPDRLQMWVMPINVIAAAWLQDKQTALDGHRQLTELFARQQIYLKGWLVVHSRGLPAAKH